MQQAQHRVALIQVQPDVSFRLGRPGQCLTQETERLVTVAAGIMGEGLQHPDLQQAAVASGAGGRVVQPTE